MAARCRGLRYVVTVIITLVSHWTHAERWSVTSQALDQADPLPPGRSNLAQILVPTDTHDELSVDEFLTPVDGEPIFVHLLAYQRTGSSFLGSILDRTPGIFYVYEPLDMVYTAMFGTKPNYNTPNAIFTSDDKLRTVTEQEQTVVRGVLDSFFQCSFTSLPSSILLHPFWRFFENNMTHVIPYNACLMKHNISVLPEYDRCRKHLDPICPKKLYNPMQTDSLRCLNLLVRNGKLVSLQDVTAANSTTDDFLRLSLTRYLQCLDTHRDVLLHCASVHLDQVCTRSRVRALKTVRGVVSTSAYFLERYSNYRLLHLFRDPRAVANSRKKTGWSQSEYERDNIYRIAEAYCGVVTSHYLQATEARAKYPGKVQQVLHEKLLETPRLHLELLFRFIGMDVPDTTWNYFEGRFNSSSDIKVSADGKLQPTILHSWMNVRWYSEIMSVNVACRHFFRVIPYQFILC